MAVFQSSKMPPDEESQIGARAIEALQAAGAELADDFTCTGMPQVNLVDMADVVQGIRCDEFYFRACLFEGFAHRAASLPLSRGVP